MHTHITQNLRSEAQERHKFSAVYLTRHAKQAVVNIETSSTLTVSQFPQSEELEKFRLSKMF